MYMRFLYLKMLLGMYRVSSQSNDPCPTIQKKKIIRVLFVLFDENCFIYIYIYLGR